MVNIQIGNRGPNVMHASIRIELGGKSKVGSRDR